MKHIAPALLLVLLGSPTAHPGAQNPDTERQVVQLVEHFVALTSQLRLYALEQYVTKETNVVVARSTKSGFVNRVLGAEEWLSELKGGLTPVPFHESLSNLDVFIASGELAIVRADFEIRRDDRAVSSGVDVFTLVRLDGQWTIASIAYTSIPE